MYVNFDATATTATTTTKPFHDLEYRWNFGDAGAGNWTRGTGYNSSKNAAKGPVAAHVFETPGTYTVNVTVTNGSSTVSNSCLQIAVQDPNLVFAANTICIAATTTPVAGSGGCPSGAAVLQQSDFDVALSGQITAGKRRLLFKRGDTFNSDDNGNIIGNTGLIAAYGSGAKPIVSMRNSGASFMAFNFSNPTIASDWRIVDFYIEGNSGAPSLLTVGASRSSKQITALRIDMHAVATGYTFDIFGPDFRNASIPCTGVAPPYTGSCSDPLHDQMAIIDGTLDTISAGGNSSFFYGTRSAFMGNDFNNRLGGEHVIRTQWIHTSVIQHNTLQGAASTKHELTIRGIDYTGSPTVPAGNYTEFIVVSDNKFIGNPGSGQIVALKPQNNVRDERRRNMILERNWYVVSTGGFPLVIQSNLETTVRNEIFNQTTGANGVIIVGKEDASIDSIGAYVYNNTVYRSDSDANGLALVMIEAGSGSVDIRNNLIYAPAQTFGTRVIATGTGYTASNNSTNFNTNPNFTSTSPFNPANVKPTAGSYAIGGGVSVPVWSDFFGVATPATKGLGAVVH